MIRWVRANDKNVVGGIACPLLLASAAMVILIIIAAIDRAEYNSRQKEFKKWKPVECTYRNSTVESYKCCAVEDCRCTECSIGNMSLNNCTYQQELFQTASCCGGPTCCETVYEKCCRQVIVACCSKYCYNNGATHCTCRSCTNTVCEDCNPRCVRQVGDQLCQARCGICARVRRLITYDGYIVPNTVECGRNDTGCIGAYLRVDNTSYSCWYHQENPMGTLTNVPPTKYYEYIRGVWVAMWVFIGITAFLIIICIIACAIIVPNENRRLAEQRDEQKKREHRAQVEIEHEMVSVGLSPM